MNGIQKQQASIMHSKTKNFLIQKCASCNKQMYVSEGDSIFGGNWFHYSCWKKAEPILDN